MSYFVKVERDSVNRAGDRLVSFLIRFPRVVLAEILTHRRTSETWGDASLCERSASPEISKNSASSRAIPFRRMVDSVKAGPYVPKWTLQEKGMQGAAMSDADGLRFADETWLAALDSNAVYAERLHDMGVHKQDCNRLLEPWAWVTQLVTSSSWDNFFALRCHRAAFPPFRKLARMMFLAMRASKPVPLYHKQWHLPFVPVEEQMRFEWEPPIGDLLHGNAKLPDLIRKSAARCAWLSYENHEKDATDEAHFKTFDRLLAEVPVHASPAEHQATPMQLPWTAAFPQLRSNLPGWLQARKLIPFECVKRYEPSEEEIATWDDVDVNPSCP